MNTVSNRLTKLISLKKMFDTEIDGLPVIDFVLIIMGKLIRS